MPSSDPAVVELWVTGMHCGSCVARVTAALEKVPGVASAFVDLEGASATVVLDAPGAASDAVVGALVAAVLSTGFEAASASASASSSSSSSAAAPPG